MGPNLMKIMDTPHLINALLCEPRTDAEMELIHRLKDFAEQGTPEEIETRLEKKYESIIEQSEFRAQLIEYILDLCEKTGSKANLVKAIRTAYHNSYVEL